MMRLLLPVRPDAPAATRAALDAAIKLAQVERGEVYVYLLSVQPKLSGHVAMYFPQGELSQIQHNAGKEDLKDARELLDAARVPYTACVRVGRKAEAIAEAAREFRCGRILLGEQAAGAASRVFGSLATQVRELTGDPVVVT